MTAPASSSGGVDISTSWEALSNVPQILTDVRSGVYALKALISTPAAATSTGSPAASAAIVALGAEIAIFIARTVEAIADDVDAMGKVIENYQRIDGDVAGQCTAGQSALAATSRAISPRTGGGGISGGSGGSGTWVGTPGINPAAGDWRQPSGDPSRVDTLQRHGEQVMDFGDFADSVVDDVTDFVDGVVDGVADAVDDLGDAINEGLDNLGDAINEGLDDLGDVINGGLDDAADSMSGARR